MSEAEDEVRAGEDVAPPGEAEAEAPPGLAGLALLGSLLLALGLLGSWWMVLVVAAIAVMIFLHELGHFVTARSAGMKVTEFFIGFGPRLWSFRRGETEYGIKAVPVGAYVKIIGMSNLEEVDPADEARTYRSKPYWRRLSVAIAGSTVHFLLAFLLVTAVFVGFGFEEADTEDWTVLVQPDSPAAAAGLEDGDRLLSLDGGPVGSFDEASAWFRARPGETVEVIVERDGASRSLTVTLAGRHPQTGDAVGYLGVGPDFEPTRFGLLEGLGRSVSETRRAMWLSITGIGDLFSPDGLSGYYDNLRGNVEPGPDGAPPENRPTSVVGIVQVGDQAAQVGFVNVVYLFFFINVFIGVFNLTPLLPFDGGHVVIATYEKIRSLITRQEHRVDVAKLMPLTYAVVAILALLFVTSVYLDIADPVSIR